MHAYQKKPLNMGRGYQGVMEGGVTPVTTPFMAISYILINSKLLVVLKFFLYFSFIVPFVFQFYLYLTLAI
jgi:hypothetical protein